MAKSYAVGQGVDSNGPTDAVQWAGGFGTVVATGEFDGANLTLQYRPILPQSDYVTEFVNTDVILSQGEPISGFFLSAGQIRVTVSDADAGTDLTIIATRERT